MAGSLSPYARRIKELQPEASQRAIAEALGVGQATVHRDLADSDESLGGPVVPDALDVADSDKSSTAPDEDDAPDTAEDAKVGDDAEEAEDESRTQGEEVQACRRSLSLGPI